MPNETNERFDRLLKAMVSGPPASGQTTPTADQASGEEQHACSTDTQTPPDTSEDGDR